jgi:hypothetical protein
MKTPHKKMGSLNQMVKLYALDGNIHLIFKMAFIEILPLQYYEIRLSLSV